MFCKKCGNTLDDDAIFCEKCGTQTVKNLDFQEIGSVVKNENLDDNHLNNNIMTNEFQAPPKKKKAPIIIIISILLICLGGAFLFFFTDLFTSKEEFLNRGDYNKAYEKASSTEEKEAVLYEYLVAKSLLDYYEKTSNLETSLEGLVSVQIFNPDRAGVDWDSLGYKYCIAMSCNTKFSDSLEYALDVGYIWSDDLQSKMSGLGSIPGLTQESKDNEIVDMMISLCRSKGFSLSIEGINRINKLLSESNLKDITNIILNE